jgi:hypothetical protein
MKERQMERITLATARASVRRIIDAMHVSAPDSYIEAEILKRIACARKNGNACTPASARAIVRYAIKQHHDNVELYRAVMSGRF